PPSFTLFPYTTLFRSIIALAHNYRAGLRPLVERFTSGYYFSLWGKLHIQLTIQERGQFVMQPSATVKACIYRQSLFTNILAQHLDRKSTRLNSSHVSI